MKTLSYCLVFCAVVSLALAQAETQKTDAPPSAGGGAVAPANAGTARALSLEDCVQLALQHNLDVQIKRFGPDVARYSLSASYGNYDPTLSLAGEHDYSISPGGIDAQGRPFAGTETESDKFSAGLQGLLPWGLSYSLGGNMNDQYGTRPGFDTDPSQIILVTNSFYDLGSGNNVTLLSTNFGTVPVRDPFENTSGSVGLFQLRQPLLKNFWVDSTRLQIFLNKKNLKISELDLQFQVMSTVTAVEEAYYNLVFAEENVKVQQKAVELAERLVAENKKRVEVGTLAPLDEKQAESQAAASRADLLAAQGTRDTQQRVLKNLLTDDYTKWEKTSIQPTMALLAVAQTFDLQESWRKGLSFRPDLQQARLNLDKQGYLVRFQRNQLFPQLDLVGTYGYGASGQEFSDAFGQIGRGDNPFYSYGAQLTIPLSRTSTRNNYKSAKATKEQLALQLKQSEQNALIQIENAISVAQTDYLRVDATREARRYAEAALEAEEKKLESGKSTSFEVLRLQRDLTTARSTEIRALADYNIALAEIALSEGSTLNRRAIKLELK